VSICIKLSDLIISKRILYWALSDCAQGEFSKTHGSLVVTPAGNKYRLVDGYHRLVEILMTWKKEVVCIIDEDTDCDIQEDDMFRFNESERFCGLEVLADSEHLEDVFCQLTTK